LALALAASVAHMARWLASRAASLCLRTSTAAHAPTLAACRRPPEQPTISFASFLSNVRGRPPSPSCTLPQPLSSAAAASAHPPLAAADQPPASAAEHCSRHTSPEPGSWHTSRDPSREQCSRRTSREELTLDAISDASRCTTAIDANVPRDDESGEHPLPLWFGRPLLTTQHEWCELVAETQVHQTPSSGAALGVSVEVVASHVQQIVATLEAKYARDEPLLYDADAAPSVMSNDSPLMSADSLFTTTPWTTPADSLRTSPVSATTPVLRPSSGARIASPEEAADRVLTFSAQFSWLFAKEEAELEELFDDDGRPGGEAAAITASVVFPERAFKVALREKLTPP
jgi:hypothetical protein